MQKTILIVDDEIDLRECIAELLEAEGYSVAQAENGKAALDYLYSNSVPGLIILDYMMPIMDGRTFCELKNKEEKFNAVPVILLTAATISDEIVKTLNPTIKLNKPIDLDRFLKTIDQFLK